jgi:hypothetical protein
VLERMLAGVRDLRGVQRVRLFENDGFVLYDSELEGQSTGHLQDWQDLSALAGLNQTITLVQTGGYAILRTVALGTLLVTAHREVNLGAVRLSMEDIASQMSNEPSKGDR